ncbi:MAG: hypothetical protein OXI08_00460 [Cyanobacteria bacterium MAG IRC4_bin_6]|nr:hypothetical protein [Cyanobacteria bacterium MAG IRC3_bin_20]MDE0646546.1 hypothetical protein [Cyanobacteria bacterium MAG IRC4_bin_6]
MHCLHAQVAKHFTLADVQQPPVTTYNLVTGKRQRSPRIDGVAVENGGGAPVP